MDGRTVLEFKLIVNSIFAGLEVTGNKKAMKALNLENEDIEDVIELFNEKVKKRNPGAESQVTKQEPIVAGKELMDIIFEAIKEGFKEEHGK